MDILDELNGSPEPNEGTQTQEATEPQAETAEATEAPETEKPAQPRGPDGKFAKKETDEPIMVPLAALHETRDELKALKARLEGSQPKPEAPTVPDIFENPEGYQSHIQTQISQALTNERLNLSEELVRQSAGDEAVNAAQEWAKQQFHSNPALAQQFYSQRNPYGFLVKEYQRQQALASLEDPKELEEFRAWKAQKANPAQAPAPAAAPAPAIPTTLADAQSARASGAAYQPPSLEQILGR